MRGSKSGMGCSQMVGGGGRETRRPEVNGSHSRKESVWGLSLLGMRDIFQAGLKECDWVCEEGSEFV